MSVIPDSDENCAIWATIWVLSTGLNGSWFCICAVISLRKSAWPSVCDAAAVEPVGVAAAPLRARDLGDASVEERQRRLVLDGVLREGGLLGRRVDVVAVEAGLERHAVHRRARDRAIGVAALRGSHRLLEVDVLRLEPGGRGVGDVRGENAHALAAHFERRSMYPEQTVVGHRAGSLALIPAREVSKGRAKCRLAPGLP